MSCIGRVGTFRPLDLDRDDLLPGVQDHVSLRACRGPPGRNAERSPPAEADDLTDLSRIDDDGDRRYSGSTPNGSSDYTACVRGAAESRFASVRMGRGDRFGAVMHGMGIVAVGKIGREARQICAAMPRRPEVQKDPAALLGIGDDGQQPCPGGRGFPGRDRQLGRILGGCTGSGGMLRMLLLQPSLGGQAQEPGLAHPSATASGRVQPVTAHQVGARIGQAIHHAPEGC